MREGAPHVPGGERCQDEWRAGSCQPAVLAPVAGAELLMGTGPTLVPASQAAGDLCLQNSAAMGFLLGGMVAGRCGMGLHFLLFCFCCLSPVLDEGGRIIWERSSRRLVKVSIKLVAVEIP